MQERVRTGFQIEASAGRVAILHANLVSLGRKQLSTPARLSVHESHDGHIKTRTCYLAFTGTLKFVISLVFQRFRRAETSLGFHGLWLVRTA